MSKHVLSTNAQTRDSVRPQINPAREISRTYTLRMHKHTKTQSASDQPGNREMSSTYWLCMHRNTRFCQPQINRQGTCQARTTCECTNTRDSVSLRSNRQREMSSIVQTVNDTQTHETSVSLRSTRQGKCQAHTACQHASTQTRSALRSGQQGNIKHVLPTNAQTRRLSQPQINPARKYQAHTLCECTNRRDSVSLRSTWQREISMQRTNCECANTRDSVSLRSGQQGKCQASYFLRMHKHETQSGLRSTRQGTYQEHTLCECTNTRGSVSLRSTRQGGNVKHVLAMYAQKHKILSASHINPASENVKHVQPAMHKHTRLSQPSDKPGIWEMSSTVQTANDAQTHETQSASDQPAREMSSTYLRYVCTNTRDYVSLRSTQQG